jgi:hypothetical protein
MSANRTIYRYVVPVDGIPCKIGLTGDPVAFGALGYSAGIEFWAEHHDSAEPVVRTFTIIGTGHQIPDGARYIGTAPRTPQGLVWHLYELGDDISLMEYEHECAIHGSGNLLCRNQRQ